MAAIFEPSAVASSICKALLWAALSALQPARAESRGDGFAASHSLKSPIRIACQSLKMVAVSLMVRSEPLGLSRKMILLTAAWSGHCSVSST